MVQRCENLRFTFEAGKAIGIERKLFRQHFDGNVAIQPRITRFVDLAHAACANGREDFVRAKGST